MKHTQLALPLILSLSVYACGGGSSSNPTQSEENPLPPVDELLTGRFVDSSVIGLQYATASESGLTGENGEFSYRSGESVTFSLGDIVLPAVAGADLISPLSVFSTDDIGDIRVINLTRLLQSLDVDGVPENGITLSQAAITSATGLNVDFSSPSFDEQVVNLVANGGSVNTALIDGETALDHFQETLFIEGLAERPPEPAPTAPETEPDTGTDTPAPATNPAVGLVSEFSTLAHRVSGTLTIIDDRTLEISNFNYDGGGPSVYFYTGTDGQYRSQDGGRLIGPLLNGREYNNETLRVTLPDDLTLDDFNGVSVWCDIFSANFGDARF